MCPSLPLVVLALALQAPRPTLEFMGKLDEKRLPEASGIVQSRRHPGIFWVHNDSGNPPALFAIRRDGTIVNEFRVAIPNLDWEDIAIDNQGRLYIGDIGNNGGILGIRAIHRIEEPDPERAPTEPLRVVASTYYSFPPKQRFDAEGLYYDADSDSVVVISKRFDRREAELFAIPFKPPAPLLRPASPRSLGLLRGFVEPATGASLARGGQRLAVCSYGVFRVYERDGDNPDWRLVSEVAFPSTPVEGIAWDGADLVLVSEGRGIHRVARAVWQAATKRPRAEVRRRPVAR